jgi:anti-sigma B factor antagonist
VSLEISTRQFNDVTILDVRGKLLGSDGERLRVLSRSLVDIHPGKLLLNFADLRQIDSNGICIVVQAHLSLKKRGGNLKLITPHGQARDTLMVLHLLEIIPTFEDEAQALASFKQSSTAN